MEKESKKALIADYKERKVIGGIYSITNTISGKKHVFTATDLEGSKNRFEFSKNTQTCFLLTLQKEWDIFGAEAFRYEVLETLEQEKTQTPKQFKEDLKALEQMWKEQQ